jgi:protein TonB
VAAPPADAADVAFGAPRAGGPGIVPPRLLRQVNPKYTSNAMRAIVNGLVELEAVVRTDGTVGQVRVKRSLDALYGLDAAAVEAFREWRFQPATRNGQPIDVVVSAELEFRIR